MNKLVNRPNAPQSNFPFHKEIEWWNKGYNYGVVIHDTHDNDYSWVMFTAGINGELEAEDLGHSHSTIDEARKTLHSKM